MNISFILPVFDDWDAVVFLLKKIDDNLLKVKANFHIYLVNDSASEAKNIEKIGQIKRTKISSIEIINLKLSTSNSSELKMSTSKSSKCKLSNSNCSKHEISKREICKSKLSKIQSAISRKQSKF